MEEELRQLLHQEQVARQDAQQRAAALTWANEQLTARNHELKTALRRQQHANSPTGPEWADRQPTNEALRQHQEKHQRIIEGMNLGLLEVDLDNRIVYANRSFCRMSGYESHELSGQLVASLFPGDTSLIGEMNRNWQVDHTDSYEISTRDKQGKPVWWLVSVAPLYSATGEITGSTAIHLDITRQKQLEIELRAARQEAEQSSRAKEQFLANMSHEIRTPMHAILSIGRQLMKTHLDDRQYYFVDMMNTAADNLLVIINDVLDLSKIESGQLTLETIGFNLPSLLHQTIQVMRYKAEEKGIEMVLACPPGVAPVLVGDPYRLNQILFNLIGNAIKFTNAGHVRITCTSEPVQKNQQRIEIRVEDTGVGMDDAFLARLFDKFTQEDSSTARQFGGTGLGMSITRQLIERMGGTITVNSRKNEGTIVRVDLTLPVGLADELNRQSRSVVNTDVLHGKCILLVEDNPMNRLVATTILQQYGAEIIEVVNGIDAIEALNVARFDMVLMDVQMPVMDGLAATRQIRQEGNTDVPIIALTANASPSEYDRCMAAGMNDFLTKPFDEDELICLLAKWFDREVKFGSTDEPALADPLFDLTKLESISRGNGAFVQKMLDLFCEEMPRSVRQIKAALLANDLDRVKYLAHRIKPTIDNLTIDSLRDEIRRIERLATTREDISELSVLINKLDRIMGQIVQQIKTVEVG